MALKKEVENLADIERPKGLDPETRNLYEDLEIDEYIYPVLASGADVDSLTTLVDALLEDQPSTKVYNVFDADTIEQLQEQMDVLPKLVADRIEELVLGIARQAGTIRRHRDRSDVDTSESSDSATDEGEPEGVPPELAEDLEELSERLKRTRQEVLETLNEARQTAKANREAIEAAKTQLQSAQSAEE